MDLLLPISLHPPNSKPICSFHVSLLTYYIRGRRLFIRLLIQKFQWGIFASSSSSRLQLRCDGRSKRRQFASYEGWLPIDASACIQTMEHVLFMKITVFERGTLLTMIFHIRAPSLLGYSYQIDTSMRFQLSRQIPRPALCYYSTIANMSHRGRKPAKLWSLHPTLHDGVARLLKEDDLHFDFFHVDNDESSTKYRDTNIMGRFICHYGGCNATGWSSRKIATTIRMYPEQKYNARVYHQRCKNCNNIGRPVLDGSYAERVAYWIKKWNGIVVEKPFTSGESKGPHNSELCEGCKAGHCSESKDYWIAQMNK